MKKPKCLSVWSLHDNSPRPSFFVYATQYAANLWVWNTPRAGYKDSPKNPKYKPQEEAPPTPPGLVVATFRNDGTDPATENAELFYRSGSETTFWAKLGHADPPVSINTYKTHVWVLKNEHGEELKSWTITSSEPSKQEYIV